MRVLTDYIKLDNGKNSNFKYGEFTKSSTALRRGIYNIPNEKQWINIELLVRNILQPVRDKFGAIRITSGYRSVELCEAIGSSSSSNHARGQAADFEPYDNHINMIDIITFIDDELEYRELIAEYFPYGWIHSAYREGSNNHQIKLKDDNHNYDRVDIDYIQSIYNDDLFLSKTKY